MKIVWLLNHYAAEPTGSGGTRHYSLAKYAARHGVQLYVIAASVEHFSGRQRLRDQETARFEDHQGVHFLWVRTSPYVGNGLARIRNILQYSFRVLLPTATRGLPEPDLVVGSSVHPPAALAGYILARRHRVPFVFEIRDLWPETLVQMGRIGRNSLPAMLLRRLEAWLCHRASKIIVLLAKADEYLEGRGVDPRKVVYLSNGVDMETFEYHPPPRQDRLTFMYIGAHGQANGLDVVLEAIALLRSRVQRREETLEFEFRFIGDGPLKPGLESLARELGIDDIVTFEAPVPKERIPEVASAADAFVVNLRDLSLYRYGFSLNKLFDYLAAGRPVVFAGPSDNNPVGEAGAGILVSGDDVSGIAEAIESVASLTHQERLEMGLRGRKYAEENFAYEAIGERFSEVLLALID